MIKQILNESSIILNIDHYDEISYKDDKGQLIEVKYERFKEFLKKYKDKSPSTKDSTLYFHYKSLIEYYENILKKIKEGTESKLKHKIKINIKSVEDNKELGVTYKIQAQYTLVDSKKDNINNSLAAPVIDDINNNLNSEIDDNNSQKFIDNNILETKEVYIGFNLFLNDKLNININKATLGSSIKIISKATGFTSSTDSKIIHLLNGKYSIIQFKKIIGKHKNTAEYIKEIKYNGNQSLISGGNDNILLLFDITNFNCPLNKIIAENIHNPFPKI